MTDRTFPGTESPCPFLENGPIIRVETGEHQFSTVGGGVFRTELFQLPGIEEGEPESGFDGSDLLLTDGGSSTSGTQREGRGADDNPPKRICLEDPSTAVPDQAPSLDDRLDSRPSSSVELLPDQNAQVSRAE